MTSSKEISITNHAEPCNDNADICGDNDKEKEEEEEDFTIIDSSMTDFSRETSIIYDTDIPIGPKWKKFLQVQGSLQEKLLPLFFSGKICYHKIPSFKTTMTLS